jgi:hypothetical protein
MDPPTTVVQTSTVSPVHNPHVLWRQILGFLFWAGLILFLAPVEPIGAALCLALGGVTFMDAWISGIYKRPGKREFLNMSPMAWGIGMAVLFIIIYPTYLLNRNKLRTIERTNDLYWATVAIGVLLIVLFVVGIIVRSTMPRQ